uniref:Uncharacterized protein n=1 Tax=Setaria italica TaxID=4555 RepID=K3ZBR6_SETIT
MPCCSKYQSTLHLHIAVLKQACNLKQVLQNNPKYDTLASYVMYEQANETEEQKQG